MNKPVVALLLVASAMLVIAGEIERQRTGWHGGGLFTSMIGAVFCLAFGRILLLDYVLENRVVKLGSETLPPAKDVAAVLVRDIPISTDARKLLLRAILRAKRATSCGKVEREIAFQIVDHWGGVWELQAYEEIGGKKGFSANRVFYAGRSAEIVAKCVGI